MSSGGHCGSGSSGGHGGSGSSGGHGGSGVSGGHGGTGTAPASTAGALLPPKKMNWGKWGSSAGSWGAGSRGLYVKRFWSGTEIN